MVGSFWLTITCLLVAEAYPWVAEACLWVAEACLWVVKASLWIAEAYLWGFDTIVVTFVVASTTG